MKRDFAPAVYIMASARNGTLYIGVTSNLLQRIAQHREEMTGGFTAKYGVKLLVWFEQHATMDHAITREKQLKKWNRAWKLRRPTGYCYHHRFNAETGSTYDRCLQELGFFIEEVAEPWFEDQRSALESG